MFKAAKDEKKENPAKKVKGADKPPVDKVALQQSVEVEKKKK